MNVIKFPNPILKEKCSDVPLGDEIVGRLSQQMLSTMYAQRGIGLAAPQIGEKLNLLVYDVSSEKDAPRIIINPKIVDQSRETAIAEEACLSLPGVSAKVKRPQRIQVEFYDKDWNKKTEWYEGLESRCIQHEMDHLIGKVYIDRIGALRNVVLQKYLKSRRK